MTTTTLSPTPVFKAFDNNGVPLVSGQLFTYQAGTTTKAPTYTDSTGVTQNPNPVVLNSRGEAQVWIPPNTAYKFVLATATDTDPPASPIWTVDQINNSQLITLYGGVDIGSTNAYILNFTANFTAYADGIVIYWIPANTNTGASTINVNGLGVVSIVNQNGSALYQNQILANQVATIFFKGGQFLLVSSSGPSAFNATRVTVAQSMPASTVTDCIFNLANVNQGNAYSFSTGVFTAPIYGIYSFSATIGLTPNGTNCVLNSVYFSKNNNTLGSGLRFDIGVGLFGQQYSNTGNAAWFAGSVILPLNAGDTMRMKWDAGTSGASTNSLALASTFSGARVANI